MMQLINLRRAMTLTMSAVSVVILSSENSAHAVIKHDDDESVSFYHPLKSESKQTRQDILVNKTAKQDDSREDMKDADAAPKDSIQSETALQVIKKAKNTTTTLLGEDDNANHVNREVHVNLNTRETAVVVDALMAEGTPVSFGPLSAEPSPLDRWFEQGLAAVKNYF